MATKKGARRGGGAALPVPGGATGRPAGAGRGSSATGPSATGTSAAEAPGASIEAAAARALDLLVTDRGALLAVTAFTCWLLAHVPAFAPVFVPAWIVTGLAVGLLRPWYALLLTIVVVPFMGGAVGPELGVGEVLRVLPVLGAAVRVLADRFVVAPSLGRPVPREPIWPVVAAAVAAAGLYALTALTGYLAADRNELALTAGLQWQVGGPVAMMAAWIAGSHLAAGRDRTLTLVVLGTTVAACGLALAAWVGLPLTDLFAFVGRVEGGRLGALGYPTPTAMGLATVLPLAAAAAWRIRPWLAIAVVGLILVTLVLTWSRGPLLALVVGVALAGLASGRVDRRLALAGAAAGAVALVALVGIRYGTNIDAILATVSASMGGDTDRIRSWGAAVAIAVSAPLLGGGWNALARVADFAALRIVNAHNILLDPLAAGGVPLFVANAAVILWSAWVTWVRRHTMAVWLIASVVTFLVCGLWDIPQVRSYAAVMGGLVLGMAAGPLIGREARPAGAVERATSVPAAAGGARTGRA
jgi:O-antigen ligase